jgi:hypothetical protein
MSVTAVRKDVPSFSVKNFDEFQHYRDRSPPWIKLYNRLLDDYEFGLLRDASKFHLVAIWLLASRSENKIPYDPEWVARRINASGAVDLLELATRGFIVVDQELQQPEHVASTAQAECLSREEGQVQHIDKDIDQKNIALSSKGAVKDKPGRVRKPNATAEGFDEFWKLCPLKKSKASALKAWPRAIATGATAAEIADGMRRYALERAGQDSRYTKHPSTWLNAGCWADEPSPPAPGGNHPPHFQHERVTNGFATLLANAQRRQEQADAGHTVIDVTPNQPGRSDQAAGRAKLVGGQ